MTNDEPSEYDRKLNRMKKLMTFVVAPILFMIVGLMMVGIIPSGVAEEKPSYVEILEEIPDIHCYNINWFGQHGFQITYGNTLEEIAMTLDSHDMDFSNNEFFSDQEVIDYLVVECLHLDSRLQIPDGYDPFFGEQALDKCLQKKEGTVGSEDYCLQFKR